jgi:FkbM family methyltransferase
MIDALKRAPVIRGLLSSAGVRRLLLVARTAKVVGEPLRFTVLELATRRSAGYRLRSSGLRVFIRHGTRDVDVFREIFAAAYGADSYDPPADLAASLDASNAPRLLDVGGNVGMFGIYALGRWPGARVHSFEPDPANLPILRRVIAANRLQERWTITEAAVANEAGRLAFVSGLFAESQLVGVDDPATRSPESASVEDGVRIEVPVVDLFGEDLGADLLKIDIEGGEWSILTDERFATVPAAAIVLEWHASGCPDGDARATALAALSRAGFTQTRETEDFGHRGVIWGWRERG